ncbi:MAG: hypothetical protein AVDCRST_MAG86-2485 [uncultured Truepera sp.]|uniref:Uncharacterized protein n=1 Tax=uncultured Truepera sp. TaxID=543023 RepID=A0A6J4VJ35_9DEIN|nr:MAG: hypothetical protein AVDCRST_MAG86-2485 [uncultured Truepera sp.]
MLDRARAVIKAGGQETVGFNCGKLWPRSNLGMRSAFRRVFTEHK